MEQNNYTIQDFFKKFGVSQKAVAEKAEISVGMMRQYACGVKEPSEERLKIIQKAIRSIGKDLKNVSLI